MPTYEYECSSCQHNFELFQSMSDEPVKVCPKCGKRKVRRLIFGGTGVIFKGNGFYVTDNKGSSSKKSVKEEGTGSSGNGKEETAKSSSDSGGDKAKEKKESSVKTEKKEKKEPVSHK